MVTLSHDPKCMVSLSHDPQGMDRISHDPYSVVRVLHDPLWSAYHMLHKVWSAYHMLHKVWSAYHMTHKIWSDYHMIHILYVSVCYSIVQVIGYHQLEQKYVLYFAPYSVKRVKCNWAKCGPKIENTKLSCNKNRYRMVDNPLDINNSEFLST